MPLFLPPLPFVSSEVETPIDLEPSRWVSRLRSTRTEIRGSLRLDMPFVQAPHAVHLRRQPLVVRRDQRRRAMVAYQLDELVEHTIGGGLVEVARRLVGKHQPWPVGQRARHRPPRSAEHPYELHSFMR